MPLLAPNNARNFPLASIATVNKIKRNQNVSNNVSRKSNIVKQTEGAYFSLEHAADKNSFLWYDCIIQNYIPSPRKTSKR